ncbi:hypothetical protein JX266_005839 [Neoarthrinium moseri]|nr:hypothetical protein JX266_005839 [Neoarthrinium moseri]
MRRWTNPATATACQAPQQGHAWWAAAMTRNAVVLRLLLSPPQSAPKSPASMMAIFPIPRKKRRSPFASRTWPGRFSPGATDPGGRDRQNLQEGARWGDINSKSKPSQWCRRSLDWAFVAPRPAETFIMLPPPKSPPNSDDTSNPQLPRDLLYVSYATPPRVQVIASTARLDWYQLAALVALSMRQPQDFGNTAETTTHGSSLTPPVI